MQHDQRRHRQATKLHGAGAIALLLLAGSIGTMMEPAATAGSVGTQFALCAGGPRINCVVDGDTFWMAGKKIRIADIDTPETHPSRCALEARLGERATRRLQALLNAGPITLVTAGRATDRYGRQLRTVERDGESLGDMLVDEGLARRWTGRRRSWCV
jgi:micrococcal nuclease